MWDIFLKNWGQLKNIILRCVRIRVIHNMVLKTRFIVNILIGVHGTFYLVSSA